MNVRAHPEASRLCRSLHKPLEEKNIMNHPRFATAALIAVLSVLATWTAAGANPLVLGYWDFEGDTLNSPPSSTPPHPAYPTPTLVQTGWAISGSSTADLDVVNGVPGNGSKVFQQS